VSVAGFNPVSCQLEVGRGAVYLYFSLYCSSDQGKKFGVFRGGLFVEVFKDGFLDSMFVG
jgi:hypothetical protein